MLILSAEVARLSSDGWLKEDASVIGNELLQRRRCHDRSWTDPGCWTYCLIRQQSK